MLSVSKARLLAALVPVALYTIYLHWYHVRMAAGGEEAFVNRQAMRYELYYANGGSWGIHILAAVFTVAMTLVLYELATALIEKWLK